MIKDLLFEQYKNFKIIFRNLSSLLLLIIGPLALILLIGFAYSGDSIHDIKIGVISKDYNLLEPAFANFSSFSEISLYDSADACIKQIFLQKAHICLEFSDDFVKDEELPTGTITFYFDNSKKSLSNKIVSVISDYFGIEAEKISIEGTKTIFSNIRDLVLYLNKKNEDIILLINESQSIKSDLLERHRRLVEIREEFSPAYYRIKELNQRLDNISRDVNASYSEYLLAHEELEYWLGEVKKTILFSEYMPALYAYERGGSYIIEKSPEMLENISYINLTYYNYTLSGNNLTFIVNISTGNITPISINLSDIGDENAAVFIERELVFSIEGLEKSLAGFREITDSQHKSIVSQKAEFDKMIYLLDSVKLLLDTDIAATEEYVKKIEAASAKVGIVQQELNRSMLGLSKLDPAAAESLIRPILKNYEPVLLEIENIKLAFPGMLAIIIIFISILFSNIVTLTEINSKAFYRNLLAPVKGTVFIFGLLITSIIIVVFQISVLLLVGQLKFRIDLFGSITSILVFIILLSLIFICFGMLIAMFLKNSQTSVLTATFIALAFFLFSDAVTPIEAMLPVASAIAAKNPFVIAALAFKKIIIFGLPLSFTGYELVILSAYFVVLFFALIAVTLIRIRED